MAYSTYQPQQQQYQHPTDYRPPYSHSAPQYAPPAPTYTTPTPPTKPTPHTAYQPLASPNDNDNLARLDATHKRRIRILKVLARIIATLLSLATFLPLAATLIKFLQTRNQVIVVDGVQRTAWPMGGSTTWYTYLYFGVAAVSLILNTAVLASYCCGGHKRAEKTARVEGWWNNIQRVVEVLIWVASVAIYRYGKQPDAAGQFKDLWGWTCSSAADAIQSQVPNVNFGIYCSVQTTSFYTGILHVLALLLTGCLYIYAIVRWRSKSKLGKATLAMEPLRQ